MAGWLEGRVALVTGGGTGIGRATALVFAREDATVVVSDLDADSGEATASTINEAGGESIFVKSDASKEEDVEALVAHVVATYGRLDCAFNNAGIERELTFPDQRFTQDTLDSVIDVNLKGVWLCMKHEIPQMIKQGGGAIVNTASIAGLGGVEKQPIYVASKHGVSGLTKAMAVEYASQGVRINAVCPGLIRTDLMERIYQANPELRGEANSWQPIGRVGEPAEIAEAVVWLSSDKASFVVGHTMTIDGGLVAR